MTSASTRGPGGAPHPDRNVQREFLRHLFATLHARHSREDAFLVRVLCERYQAAAMTAKAGDIATARAEIAALERGVAASPDPELRDAVAIAAEPARALADWREGDLASARVRLEEAMAACGRLAGAGHDYLTAKYLHFALNIARLDLDRGDARAAESTAEAVGQVIDAAAPPASVFGAAARWLRLPLDDLDDAAVRGQLAALRARIGASALGR